MDCAVYAKAFVQYPHGELGKEHKSWTEELASKFCIKYKGRMQIILLQSFFQIRSGYII
jgi:hypothetical protein